MKRVLIISPHFPPVNAADMHRVRQSISYYEKNGWIPEIVTVHPEYIDFPEDSDLLKTIPADVKIHYVKAISSGLTQRIGFGGIAYRSFFNYYSKVNELLSARKYDLIFFSTTMMPVCILGPVWKRKFNVPFVIDMQDPWRSDHYKKMKRSERPPKFLLSYFLDYHSEKFVMKRVDGIISVSQDYINVLRERYNRIKNVPAEVITFSALQKDVEILSDIELDNIYFSRQNINICYIGRGGKDMHTSLKILFNAFKTGLDKNQALFSGVRFYFIGTNYDTSPDAAFTIKPLADELGIGDYVKEYPARIGYFKSLKLLSEADLIVIPGSDQAAYSASKIYPYVLLKKPLLTIFHENSNVNKFLEEVEFAYRIKWNENTPNEGTAFEMLNSALNNSGNAISYNENAMQKYSAENMTKKIVRLFNEVVG